MIFYSCNHNCNQIIIFYFFQIHLEIYTCPSAVAIVTRKVRVVKNRLLVMVLTNKKTIKAEKAIVMTVHVNGEPDQNNP